MSLNIVEKDKERFFAKVKKTDSCWLWTAAKDGHGYGVFKHKGKMLKASRLSYVLHKGEIPEHDSYHGYCVCHKCDNPECVNPEHLFLGLNKDNVLDMVEKGRKNPPRGKAHWNKRLSEQTICRIKILKNALSSVQIAEILGVPRGTVANILFTESRNKAFSPQPGNVWGL